MDFLTKYLHFQGFYCFGSFFGKIDDIKNGDSLHGTEDSGKCEADPLMPTCGLKIGR